MADPNPNQSSGMILGDRAVVNPNSCGPKLANLLQSDGRMIGVVFEDQKILVGQPLDVFW
jgi:hypothetical protein